MLMFPISYDENIADIWRGYIMEYFIWKMKGVVIYYSSDSLKRNEPNNKYDIIKEKKNYFELNKLFEILSSYSGNNNTKNYLELYLEILEVLVSNSIIKKKDHNMYKIFIKDLINVGYNFSSSYLINANYTVANFLKNNPDFLLYNPKKPLILKTKNLKLVNHLYSNKIYNDILLIINYNKIGFIHLNKYLINLYSKNFPHIIFISPCYVNQPNIITCLETERGSYSYYCFKKIYLKYPNYRGYLYINEDLFLKAWELVNFNFSIPWLNQYIPISKYWFHNFKCYQVYKILENNLKWKNNILEFLGYFAVVHGLSDFYYLPNFYASKIIKIFDKMFESYIYNECAIPNSMGILLASQYQIINITPLLGKDRKKAINYLYSQFEHITFHPIKFSNEYSKIKVLEYINFINANYY